MSATLETVKTLAVVIPTAVLSYYGLTLIEAWTIETLCRELLRCVQP